MEDSRLAPVLNGAKDSVAPPLVLGSVYKRKGIQERLDAIDLEPDKGPSKDPFILAFHWLERHITKNGYNAGERICPEQVARGILGKVATAKEIVKLADKISAHAWITAGVFSERTTLRLDVEYRKFGPKKYRVDEDYNRFFVPENADQALPYEAVRSLLKAAKDDGDRLVKQSLLLGPGKRTAEVAA